MNLPSDMVSKEMEDGDLDQHSGTSCLSRSSRVMHNIGRSEYKLD